MAVGNWIPTGSDAQSRMTNLMRAFVQSLQNAANLGLQIKNIQAQMLAGGSDYSTIETYFSIPTGSGSSAAAKIGTASDDLQGSNIQGVIQLLG